jgi:hypothetical protein
VAPIFHLLGEGYLDREGVAAVMAVIEAEGLPDVPALQMARASQITLRPRVSERQRAEAGASGMFRRLVAMLVMDLRPWAAPSGVRGAALAGVRLMFVTGAYEVVVQESRGTKRRAGNLVGQILRDGDPVPSATVLLVGGTRRTEAEADMDGTFSFKDIGSGSYEIDVWTGDDLIVCGPVRVDERAH